MQPRKHWKKKNSPKLDRWGRIEGESELKLAGCRKLAWLWVCLILLALGGCGKKGPPVPPRCPRPPEPRWIGILPDGQSVVLRWRIDINTALNVRAFHVLEAADRLDEKECPGCPLRFKRIGVLKAEKRKAVYSFRVNILPGYRYTFRIRSVGLSEGLYSDSGTISYPDREDRK